MADAITIKALQDASLDAKSLEEVVNGNETKQVTTRLGETYPSVKKAIKMLFENGGIADRFKTLADLQASPLVDGAYALVADDTDENNGIYIKEGGTWKLSKYTYKAEPLISEIPHITEYTHVFTDAVGNFVETLGGVRQKPDITESYSGSVADMRAGILDSEEMTNIGLSLDYKNIYEKTPLKMLIDVADVGSDDTVMQRMPNAVKINDNKLFVIFTQFSTAGSDTKNGRLVGRFVNFDTSIGTSEVGETIPIVGEKIGSLDRHPVVLKLKNKVALIYNNIDNLPVLMESYDSCETWVDKGVISVEGSPLRMVTLNGAVQITSGKYAGRIVLAVQTGVAEQRRQFGVWYSDDECETWSVGFTEYSDIFEGIGYINEISLALDADQNMTMTFRSNESIAEKRYVLFGKVYEGGNRFEPLGINPAVETSWSVFGFCQLAPYLEDGVPKIVLAHPASKDTERKKFRVRISYDNCQSFVSEYAPIADDLYMGYSSVIPINSHTFAVVYEQGHYGNNASIKLLLLNLAEAI